MAANLVRRYPPEQARHLLNLSFAQYHADRDVVSLERQLERAREQLARATAAANDPAGDVGEYRRLVADLDAAKRTAATAHATRLDTLRPGDVVLAPRRGGKVVVLKQDRGRGGNRVLALTVGRDLVRLGSHDFRGPIRKVATMELPAPVRAAQPDLPARRRRRAAAAQRRRAGRVGRRRVRPGRVARSVGRREHPLHDSPGLANRLRAASQADRIEREIARLERRSATRNESLARQFDRVLGVLEAWGYLEGWGLSPAGELLARLNTEGDLVLAESLREGLLDGLDPPDARRPRCRASRTSAAAPTATSRCRRAGGRARCSPAGRAASRTCGGT